MILFFKKYSFVLLLNIFFNSFSTCYNDFYKPLFLSNNFAQDTFFIKNSSNELQEPSSIDAGVNEHLFTPPDGKLEGEKIFEKNKKSSDANLYDVEHTEVPASSQDTEPRFGSGLISTTAEVAPNNASTPTYHIPETTSTEIANASTATNFTEIANASNSVIQLETAILHSQPSDALPFIEYPTCDVAFESTVCFFSQEHVLLPPARPYGLVGHYSFDAIKPLDTSGYRHHAIGTTIATFPMGTTGASALFRKHYIFIQHSKLFETTDYSITFWIYLMEDEVSRKSLASTKPLSLWCPILHKGLVEKDRLNSEIKMESKPSILIDPITGRLKVVESTDEVEAAEGEFFIGNFQLKNHRWYHIAFVRHQKTSRLYVNGILDSTAKTKGLTRNNKMPFYIGNTPWTQTSCDLPLALDELKIYSIAIGRDIIEAEGAAALSGIEPFNFFFSCIGCTKLQAEEGCPESFHLCTKLEFIMGGYDVVERLGLYRDGYTLFTGEQTVEIDQLEGHSGLAQKSNNNLGIGFCCHDSVN